ncbi:MAG: peptidoglycan-binding domain-containing protein [Patescibacteria group bacterium]
MNKLFLTGILTLTMFAVTPVVYAQVGDVDPLGSSSQKTCANLSSDLRLTSRDSSTGGQVSDLQFFLQTNGNFNLEPTGYFGLMTFGAVQRYQSANWIVPASGFVGPITRAKINASSCQPPIIIQNTDIVPAISTPVGSTETGSKIKLIAPDGGLFGTEVVPPIQIKWLPKNQALARLVLYTPANYMENQLIM